MPSSPIERAPESFLERIPVIGRLVKYVKEHPIKGFFKVTLGLALANHLGLLQFLPAAIQPALTGMAAWSRNMYMLPIQRLGENLENGFPTWLSTPAQTFANATRGIMRPPGSAPLAVPGPLPA